MAGDGNNQGRFVRREQAMHWEGLRFSTASELAIARALDAAGVVFFPLAVYRITERDGTRVTRECDFLVIYNGVTGILELGGWPHDGRAADDHRRDRLLKFHAGVWVIERVASYEALKNPERIVRGLLAQMERFRLCA